MRTLRHRTRQAQGGFSLVELMVTTVILVIIFAIVMNGIVKLQRRNSAETSKTDMTQQARDFMDQSVRDLHQAGYPSWRSIAGLASTNAPTDARVAAGMVSLGNYSIQFEADTDGSGTVNDEVIQLVDSAGTVGGTTCPCTLQRGVETKTQYLAGGAITYYTQLGNVTNTTSGTPVFVAYDSTGTATTVLSNIRTVRMTVNVQSPNADLDTKVAPTLSLTSEAKISNQ